MALSKKKEKKARDLYNSMEAGKLFTRVSENRLHSYEDVVQPNVEDWNEKEAMMMGVPLDSYTRESASSVNDPRLATMVLERSARVMAQNPTGKAMAMSKDDKGKNMLMNLLLDKWVLPNANSQYSFLIKSRLWDQYSLIYGTQFALVDKVFKESYYGPDFWLLPIRDCRPQAGKFSVEDSDYFGVDTWVSRDYLKNLNKDTWKNIDDLLLLSKEKPMAKGESNSNERTFMSRQREPSVRAGKTDGMVRIYTEYRRDRWVTIAPDYGEEKLVLRNIENPHGDGQLPIVAKYCFPNMESIYGLGEFERGKTLQYSINSLINLYLDGVKMSIFPPVILDADGIVASTIMQEPAAKWLQTKPNSINQLPLNIRGMDTFQGTYNFLLAALQNQGGTTDTSVSAGSDPTYGKTPRALNIQAARENARDSWDRFMMEESLQSLMGKFVNITANCTSKDVKLNLFASELEDIKAQYPDVVEMFTSGERGEVNISEKEFKDVKYNYEITKGSTYKVDQAEQNQIAQGLLNFTVANYGLLSMEAAKQGKKIDIIDLFTKTISSTGLQDSEKIIKDMTPEEQQALQQQQKPQQDTPNVSISFKDLPPDGQVQAAAQAGIQIDPQTLQMQKEQQRQMDMASNAADLADKMAMPEMTPFEFTDPNIANVTSQMFPNG